MNYALALALFASLGHAACAAPLAAQQADTQAISQAEEVYGALYDAITADPDNLAARSAASATATLIMQSDDNMARLAGREPALEQTMAAAMMPTFAAHMGRLRTLYRPRYIALFADELDPQRAVEITDIMASPQGLRVLRGARENVMAGISADRLLAAEPLTEDETRDLIGAQQRAVLAETDRADQLAFQRMAMENPAAFADLARLRELMVPLRTQMDNEPLLPAHEAQLTAAIEKVFAKLFP